MRPMRGSGLALVVIALSNFAYNASDTIADLQDWHGLSRPAMVAVLLRRFATVVLAVMGGTLIGRGGGNGK